MKTHEAAKQSKRKREEFNRRLKSIELTGVCAEGRSAIFHVSGHEKGKKDNVFGNATIEVNANTRSIVQIKGKCNAGVDAIALRIIKRWAQSSNLKMKTY